MDTFLTFRNGHLDSVADEASSSRNPIIVWRCCHSASDRFLKFGKEPIVYLMISISFVLNSPFCCITVHCGLSELYIFGLLFLASFNNQTTPFFPLSDIVRRGNFNYFKVPRNNWMAVTKLVKTKNVKPYSI